MLLGAAMNLCPLLFPEGGSLLANDIVPCFLPPLLVKVSVPGIVKKTSVTSVKHRMDYHET